MTSPLVASIRLKVSFPPKSLDIFLTPKVVKVGQVLLISCKSSSSNPASKLSWWKNGDEILGSDGGTVDAEFGGKSTVSRLEVVPEVEDHGEIYACRATNVLLEQAVSDAVTLNVSYKPYFPLTVAATVDVVEHQSVAINIVAVGNPPHIEYTWYRDNVALLPARGRRAADVVTPRFWQSGAVLNMTRAERSDAGNYTVEARNSEGSRRHTVNVNVQFPAEISTVFAPTLVNLGDTATLECTARANPINLPSLIAWSRIDGYDMKRVVTSVYDVGASRLVITGAVKGDSGVFMCTASNGIGKPALAYAKLIVRYAPVVDKSPSYGKAAADKGSTAVLQCRAEGAPTVVFIWFKESVELTGALTTYVIPPTKQTGLVSYETELHVFNTSKTDYGQYTCVARNELGEDSIIVKLDGTSKPDSPYDLHLVNSTHNSITLSWRAGFDGGSPVHYQIRYKELDSEIMKYEDVLPTGANQYAITGLKLASEYEITARAINHLGDGEFQEQLLRARTSAVLPPGESSEDVPLIIILTVCVIGMVLLALNILLVLFFIRRRRRKLDRDDDNSSVSQANTLEMVNTPPAGMDDYKSYTTFDQHSGDDIDEEKLPLDVQDDDYPGNVNPYYPYSGVPHPNQSGAYSGRYPMDTTDSPYSDDKRGLGQDSGYRGAYSSGSLPRQHGGGGGGVDPAMDEDDIYTDQLRRMQMNLTAPRYGGSSNQLPSNSYYSSAAPNRSSSRSAVDGGGGVGPSGGAPHRSYAQQYGPSLGDAGYAPSMTHRVPATPPELRGALV